MTSSCSAKPLFWPLLNIMTQEEKGIYIISDTECGRTPPNCADCVDLRSSQVKKHVPRFGICSFYLLRIGFTGRACNHTRLTDTAAVHHELRGSADIELKVILNAPRDLSAISLDSSVNTA